jgi:hypothetical protein
MSVASAPCDLLVSTARKEGLTPSRTFPATSTNDYGDNPFTANRCDATFSGFSVFAGHKASASRDSIQQSYEVDKNSSDDPPAKVSPLSGVGDEAFFITEEDTEFARTQSIVVAQTKTNAVKVTVSVTRDLPAVQAKRLAIAVAEAYLTAR